MTTSQPEEASGSSNPAALAAVSLETVTNPNLIGSGGGPLACQPWPPHPTWSSGMSEESPRGTPRSRGSRSNSATRTGSRPPLPNTPRDGGINSPTKRPLENVSQRSSPRIEPTVSEPDSDEEPATKANRQIPIAQPPNAGIDSATSLEKKIAKELETIKAEAAKEAADERATMLAEFQRLLAEEGSRQNKGRSSTESRPRKSESSS